MEIFNMLPPEISNKIKYYVLEHPIAKIIKDEIERLRCDEYYTFRDKQNKIFCKIDGRDHFCNEYFLRLKKTEASLFMDITMKILIAKVQMSILMRCFIECFS